MHHRSVSFRLVHRAAMFAAAALISSAIAAGSALAASDSSGGHSGHSMSMPMSQTAQTPAGKGPAATGAQAKSDTRARIEQINKAEGKVKLKHGPVPRLDMPGMTMTFRVQDPKLLDQVKEGEEVGVTLEKVGNAFVVTGFQK